MARSADCGCLGSYSPAPWAMFAIDLSAIAILFIAQPLLTKYPVRYSEFRSVAIAGLIAATVTSSFFLVLTIKYGSIRDGIDGLQGHRFGIADNKIHLGERHISENVSGELMIHNYERDPLTLLLVSMDCRCAEFAELPLEIEGHGRKSVLFRFHVPHEEGVFKKHGQLITSKGTRHFTIYGLASTTLSPSARRPETRSGDGK